MDRRRRRRVKDLTVLAGRQLRPDGVQASAQTVLPGRIQLQWHYLAASTCPFRLLWVAIVRALPLALFLPLELHRLQDFDRWRATRRFQQTREHLSQRERDRSLCFESPPATGESRRATPLRRHSRIDIARHRATLWCWYVTLNDTWASFAINKPPAVSKTREKPRMILPHTLSRASTRGPARGISRLDASAGSHECVVEWNYWNRPEESPIWRTDWKLIRLAVRRVVLVKGSA